MLYVYVTLFGGSYSNEGHHFQGPRGGHDAFKDKKIFIGGLPNSVDEEFLKSFFAKYGRVSLFTK